MEIELLALLRLMQEHRATRVKLPNGTEVELSPLAFALPTESRAESAPVGVEHGGEPTDEQLLMWSAPGELPRAQQPEAE
jgi:hypothetical protein